MFALLTMVFNVLSDEDRTTVYADANAYCAFVEGDERYALAAFFWLYCQKDIVARTPLLTDPAFLLKLDTKFGKHWDSLNRDSIWQFADVPRHAEVNGQVRPVIDVSLNDLRKVVRPTIQFNK